MRLDKNSIRSQIKVQRRDLSPAFCRQVSRSLCRRLGFYLNRFDDWLLYAPLQNEVLTDDLFDLLQKRGKSVFYPRVTSAKKMQFLEVKHPSDFEDGRFGREPKKGLWPWSPERAPVSLAIVPGLAFGRLGARLGFGRGFYDRFLNQYPKIHRVGLAYDFQIIPEMLELEPHDAPMDEVVCPAARWGSPRI